MIVFQEKYRDIKEMEKISRAAETLELRFEIDWDARECSLDDSLYEITVFNKEDE